MTKAANRQLRFLRVFIRGSSNLYTADRRTRATVEGAATQQILYIVCTNICTTLELYEGDKKNLQDMSETHNTQPTQRTCAAELGEKPADGRNFPQLLPRQYPPNTTTAQYTHYVIPRVHYCPLHSQTNYYCPIYTHKQPRHYQIYLLLPNLPAISTSIQMLPH